MRNIPLQIFLVLTQLLWAQNTTVSESQLLGKWKINKVEIENVITAEQGKSPDLADTSASKSQDLINNFAKGISDVYLNSVLYFKPQSKLKIKAKRKKIKGTYTLHKTEPYIITDIEYFKKLYVQKLEGNALVINQVDDNKVIKLTLIKK